MLIFECIRTFSGHPVNHEGRARGRGRRAFARNRLWTAALRLTVLAMALTGPGAARAEGVAQLVMIEEHGCPWCERWDEEIGVVYNRTTEGRQAPLRRIDMAAPLPADLSFLEKGRYTPTFVVVASGREIGRIRGYPGEDFFWPMLQQLLDRLPAQAPTETPALRGGS